MFSISQTNLGYYCFEWTATEQGPKIIQNKFIGIKNNLDEEHTFNNIVEDFSPRLKEESNSLTVVLDYNQVNISSFKIDKHISSSYYINWYERNIFGAEYLEEYENFYYPLVSKKNNYYLIVSIKKNYKKVLCDVIKKTGFNLVCLSVNLFSAATITKQIYKIKNKEDFLIWKVDKNNHHFFTYYIANNLAAILKIKLKRNKKIDIIQKIGESIFVKKINTFVDEYVVNKNQYSLIKKIFIYHNKLDDKTISNFIDTEKCNIKQGAAEVLYTEIITRLRATDKEDDQMGGNDVYSGSKGAAELVIKSK